MRAYLSFVLVLFCLMLLISLLQYTGYTSTKSLINERAYLISMNVKEALIESARQGSLEGFRDYDSVHSVDDCIHCPPCHPELCDPVRCQTCFRESDARTSARTAALGHIEALRAHVFDPDFFVTIGPADIDEYTKADPAARNGFSLDSFRISATEISISSEKFGLEASARLPGGLIHNASDH